MFTALVSNARRIAIMIEFSTWTPEPIMKEIRDLEGSDLATNDNHEILQRLASDERMQNIYGELLRRSRSSGEFLHPSKKTPGEAENQTEEKQFHSIRKLLRFSFEAAARRTVVSKQEEVAKYKEQAVSNAELLIAISNDLELALTSGQLGEQDAFSKALGLAAPTRRLLDQLVKAAMAKPNGRLELPRRIKPGSELVRTWKGKRYRVRVMAEGFAYDGKTYASLSEIASAITGTRWNGPRFFGLRSALTEVGANG